MAWVTAFVYGIGSLVCHQIPERSFYYGSVQFPVCARCTGIYLGALCGLTLWTLNRHREFALSAARRAVILGAAPTLITVAAAALGWWDLANAWRAVVGVPLGLTIAFVIATGLAGHLR